MIELILKWLWKNDARDITTVSLRDKWWLLINELYGRLWSVYHVLEEHIHWSCKGWADSDVSDMLHTELKWALEGSMICTPYSRSIRDKIRIWIGGKP